MPDHTERFRRLLALMRCPSCRDAYRYEPMPQRDATGLYGLLSCRCRTWPVIDAIPIMADRRVGAYEHTRAGEEYVGRTPAELVEMVRAGRGLDALLDCLSIPIALPMRLRRLPVLQKVSRHPLALGIGSALRRSQIRRMLSRPADRVTAHDWLRLFYGRWSPLRGDLHSYFFHRFAMPRTLAALSLAATIPRSSKPLLDVACGCAHLAHSLTTMGITDWTVEADFNFAPMWAASRTIAPHASFVFLDASQALPFDDDQFGAVLCSDAFAYIPNRAGLLAEMHRCVDAGPLVLTRVNNLTALPIEADDELTAPQYAELLGRDRTWIFSEDELVKCYLWRRTPDLTARPDPARLEHDKWLSMVVLPESIPPAASRRIAAWPHAAGTLQLNPLYEATPQRDGSVQLRVHYPTTWFALENAGATVYLPPEATITRDAVEALRAGRRTSEIETLISRFVLLGLPESYAPDVLGLRQRPSPEPIPAG
jgi:SAM-dependent methyltransferase/uncharacterized protein YbaR (Trm112 family)